MQYFTEMAAKNKELPSHNFEKHLDQQQLFRKPGAKINLVLNIIVPKAFSKIDIYFSINKL